MLFDIGIFVLTALWFGVSVFAVLACSHYETKYDLEDNAIIKVWGFVGSWSGILAVVYAFTQPIFWIIAALVGIIAFTVWVSFGVNDFIRAIQKGRIKDEDHD